MKFLPAMTKSSVLRDDVTGGKEYRREDGTDGFG